MSTTLFQLFLVLSALHAGSSINVTVWLGESQKTITDTTKIEVEANKRVKLSWTVDFADKEEFEKLTLYSNDASSGIGSQPIYWYDKNGTDNSNDTTISNSLNSFFVAKTTLGPPRLTTFTFTIKNVSIGPPFQNLQLQILYKLTIPPPATTTPPPATTPVTAAAATTTTPPATTKNKARKRRNANSNERTIDKEEVSKVKLYILEEPSVCGMDMQNNYMIIDQKNISVEVCGNPRPQIKWSVPESNEKPFHVYPAKPVDETLVNVSGTGLSKTIQKTQFKVRLNRLTTDNFAMCGRKLKYEITGIYKEKKISKSKEAVIMMRVKPRIADMRIFRPKSGCMFLQWSVKDTGLCDYPNINYIIKFYDNRESLLVQKQFVVAKNEESAFFYCKDVHKIERLQLFALASANTTKSTPGNFTVSEWLVGEQNPEGENGGSMKAAVIALAVLLGVVVVCFVICGLWVKKKYLKKSDGAEISGKPKLKNDNSKKGFIGDEENGAEQEMYEIPTMQQEQKKILSDANKKHESVKNVYVSSPTKEINKKKKKVMTPTSSSLNHHDKLLYQNNETIVNNSELTTKKQPKKVPVPRKPVVVADDSQEIYENFSTLAEEQTVYEVPPEDN